MSSSDSNNNGKNNQKRESIFGIMDNIMLEMSKTKKMFLVMVLTILILPPIGLLMMTAAFDNPFFPDMRGFEIHEEWEDKSYQLRDMLLEIENTSPELRQDKLEETLQSAKYIELTSRLNELSEQYPHLEKDPPKGDKPPVKPLQLIIFVISGIWLGIGIRQWYIMSKWDSKYKQFKKQQEEVDKKIDEEPEENDDQGDNEAKKQ
ncbi:hypothetical protein [Nitrosopumilus sp.]|uniref:hypothetical protein n=1 Tax=Nitrosopumilus sp. TaxID=2024843 RepID=UPI002931822B|nr:hypothetical protein [Nitrosopumilus sp.]